MLKSYFVQDYQFESGFGYLYTPKLVLLSVSKEEFLANLKEKLDIIVRSGKDIEDYPDIFIDVYGAELCLEDFVKNHHGCLSIKQAIDNLKLFVFDESKAVAVGEPGKLFFVEQKVYLLETEDEYDIKYTLISCESQEKFKEIFTTEFEKALMKGKMLIEFDDLFFHNEDFSFERIGKKFKVSLPTLIEV